MTKEALKLALEALEYAGPSWIESRQPAITAIKEALANEALDKMAENARELGLDYEPVAWNAGIPSLHPKMKEGETISVEYVELTPPQQDGECKHCTDGCPACDARKLPEQEPVTWRNAAIRVGEDLCSVGPFRYYDMTAEQWLDWALSVVTVHAPPPQRKPLTENEIKHLWYEACQTSLELTSQLIVHLARNIEAAHGIKGEA